MKTKLISEGERLNILKRVKNEFPSLSSMQELHYYRYIKELEQKGMTVDERIKDDRERMEKAKKELGL